MLGAVCSLLVARPLFPSEAPPENGDGLPVVMLWIVLAVVWLLAVVGRQDFRFRFGWADAAIGLLIAWHTLAGIRATLDGSPRPAINVTWEWIGFGLAFVLVRQLVASRREARALMVVMAALAVALAGYGLYQYFYEMPRSRLDYYQHREAVLREMGLPDVLDSPEVKRFEARMNAAEPMATFALTNSLAGLLVPWLAAIAGIAVSAGPARQRLRIASTAALCGLVIGACLVLTKSRSGYLAALLGMIFAVWVSYGRRRTWSWKVAAVAGGGVLAVFGLGIAAGALDVPVLTEAVKSLGYRIQYWQATLGMIADHPLFGCGPGQFSDAYTVYKLPIASEEIGDPHNFLLEIWATAGTPAALAMVTALLLYATSLLRSQVGSACQAGPLESIGASSVVPSETGPARRAGPTCAPLPETVDLDATPFVLAGGAIGFLLSVPMGLMSSASPGLAPVALGLPLASVAAMALTPWVRNGHLPALLPGVAAFTLLLNLLMAGGIGFAGVAGSLWMLLALGLTLTERHAPRRIPWFAALAALGAGVLLAIACGLSAYGPVLESQAAIRTAYRQPSQAEEYLRRAASADRFAAKPRWQLAALALRRWQANGSAAALEQFEEYLRDSLRLEPYSSSAWAGAGNLYLEAYTSSNQRTMLDKAVEAYLRAVELYPSSAQHRANLALALRATGDTQGFREHAGWALSLHELTPHQDKKLDPKLVDELRATEPRKTSTPN